jgi:hypothetical protein
MNRQPTATIKYLRNEPRSAIAVKDEDLDDKAAPSLTASWCQLYVRVAARCVRCERFWQRR